MPCKHEETKIVSIIEDTGDVRQTVCTEEGCGFILKEEVLITRGDGEEFWRPRGVKLEDQPEGFEFAGKDGERLTPEEKILSAREMALLAVKTREETIGKQSRELVKEILDKCIKVVLEGEFTHLVTPEDDIPGEIIVLAVRELKAQGYRVKKTPQPGEGVWIEVKWSTRAPRKKKGAEEEIKFGRKTTMDNTTARQQRAATKHRKAAMKARLSSPE